MVAQQQPFGGFSNASSTSLLQRKSPNRETEAAYVPAKQQSRLRVEGFGDSEAALMMMGVTKQSPSPLCNARYQKEKENVQASKTDDSRFLERELFQNRSGSTRRATSYLSNG